MQTLTDSDEPKPDIADALIAIRTAQPTEAELRLELHRLKAIERKAAAKHTRNELRAEERADVKRADHLAQVRARRRQASIAMAEYLKEKGYDI